MFDTFACLLHEGTDALLTFLGIVHLLDHYYNSRFKLQRYGP